MALLDAVLVREAVSVKDAVADMVAVEAAVTDAVEEDVREELREVDSVGVALVLDVGVDVHEILMVDEPVVEELAPTDLVAVPDCDADREMEEVAVPVIVDDGLAVPVRVAEAVWEGVPVVVGVLVGERVGGMTHTETESSTRASCRVRRVASVMVCGPSAWKINETFCHPDVLPSFSGELAFQTVTEGAIVPEGFTWVWVIHAPPVNTSADT